MAIPSRPVQQNNIGSGMRSLARALGTALVDWSNGIDSADLPAATSPATLQPVKSKDREWVEQLLASSGTTALDLRGIDLSGADLNGLDLSGANFQNAHLVGASFLSANLMATDFRNADCQDCNFLDARLQHAYFYNANLRSARLTAYSFRLHVSRSRTRWLLGDEEIALVTDRVEDYHQAREAYLGLSRALNDQGQFDDAAVFRIIAMRLHRATESPLRRHRRYRRRGRFLGVARFLRYCVRWSGMMAADILCVYGESIWRVLLWMALILLALGPLVVRITGGLDWSPEGLATLAGILSTWRQALYGYSQYVLYMFDTFTTADFSLMEPRNDAVRLVSAFLAMTGIFLTGLLGFVAGNRIRRM